MKKNPEQFLLNLSKQKKRKIKILHIGNIANNAYINSKILNRLDFIESDVFCGNYFHFAGCPEWEELNIPSNYNINQWKADFSKIRKKFNYKRPEWFIQGEDQYTLNFLYYHNKHNKLKAYYYKLMIIVRNKLIISESKFIKTIRRLRKKLINIRLNKSYKKVVSQRIFIIPLMFLYTLYRIIKILIYGKKSNSIKLSERTKEIIKKYNLKESQVIFEHYQLWKRLLEQYDVIIGYATSSIYPFLCDIPYICYEHGTIRNLPFEKSVEGKKCKMVYQNAQETFITNIDNIENAKKLSLKNITPIPHGFDDSKVTRFFDKVKENQVAVEKNANQFIAPARQHWKKGKELLKGNDKIVKAVRILKDKKYEFKIIFVEYGLEVEETKKLIKDLDVESFFTWIQPVSKDELWKYYVSCEGVLDQFAIPGIGGVAFEAIAIGAPLITSIKEHEVSNFFGKKPPYLNCHKPEEIALQIEKVLNKDFSEYKLQSREWFSKYHSSQRILDIQLECFYKILKDV